MRATTHIYVHPPFATELVESSEIGNEFVDTVSIKQMSHGTHVIRLEIVEIRKECSRSEGVMAHTWLVHVNEGFLARIQMCVWVHQ